MRNIFLIFLFSMVFFIFSTSCGDYEDRCRYKDCCDCECYDYYEGYGFCQDYGEPCIDDWDCCGSMICFAGECF